MPLYPSFLTTKLLFACIGVAFVLTKVSVYSSIGLLTADKTAHSRLTNTIEGLFMVGVLAGNWLFSVYVDSAHPGNPVWMNVYWVITGMCAVVFVLLATGNLDESAAHAGGHNNSFADSLMEMLRLFIRPLVYVFLASAFLYVLIEQSFSTWLPTFNNEILKLPNAMSIQFASILAGMTAFGRIGAGIVLKSISWYSLLNVCVVGMGVLVVLVLPLARDVMARPDIGWFNAPAAAYLIPLLGLLMAPIYPVINSVALSSLPKPMHAANDRSDRGVLRTRRHAWLVHHRTGFRRFRWHPRVLFFAGADESAAGNPVPVQARNGSRHRRHCAGRDQSSQRNSPVSIGLSACSSTITLSVCLGTGYLLLASPPGYAAERR